MQNKKRISVIRSIVAAFMISSLVSCGENATTEELITTEALITTDTVEEETIATTEAEITVVPTETDAKKKTEEKTEEIATEAQEVVEVDRPYIVLQKNPYSNIVWDMVKDVTSVSHAHCTTQDEFNTLKEHYKHVAISNYVPAVPYYPLDNWFDDTEGVLASPNAEHRHFIDSSTSLHMNSLGSYATSNSDYDGTVEDFEKAFYSSIKEYSGGGVTINHPNWSGLSKETIEEYIDYGYVIAIEIWNATCNHLDGTGYSLDIWDSVLSDGYQVYGVAVPDHEAQYAPKENREPFGYNHMLVINETEEEILNSYRLGRFYTTLWNDDLLLKEYSISGNTVSISTAVNGDITFITATRTFTVEDASSATFEITPEDVYVRVEVSTGTNRLFTNAIML